MSKLILDAGPLITACKFSAAGRVVIDYLLDACEIIVAESVRAEVVVAGARYADAQVAQERLNQGQIVALPPPIDSDLGELLVPYGLGSGEQDSILLTEHTELQDATLVIDDHLAYLVSDRLGRRKRFLLDVFADLARVRALEGERQRRSSERFRPATQAPLWSIPCSCCGGERCRL